MEGVENKYKEWDVSKWSRIRVEGVRYEKKE